MCRFLLACFHLANLCLNSQNSYRFFPYSIRKRAARPFTPRLNPRGLPDLRQFMVNSRDFLYYLLQF